MARILEQMKPLPRPAPGAIAIDHVGGGLVSRREAIRRLGWLGVSFGAASALIAGCGDDRSDDTGGDAFVDFTTKPDGDPPATLDTGQPVDCVQDAWEPHRKPQISGGKLVHGALPESGAYANYYQAQLDRDCHAFGASWTVDSSDGSSTSGVMCLAAWAGLYESGTGMTVPKTPGHIVIDTMTGVWQWWVSDGAGAKADHLQAVKLGTFAPPASDGSAVWEAAVTLDGGDGIGYLYLPGVDTATSTRHVTLTDSEIAAALAAVGLPPTTIAATSAGANVVMVEHYADSAANTARYPRFRNLWAQSPVGPAGASPLNT